MWDGLVTSKPGHIGDCPEHLILCKTAKGCSRIPSKGSLISLGRGGGGERGRLLHVRFYCKVVQAKCAR